MPSVFPNEASKALRETKQSTLERIRKIDFLGFLLSLAASALLVAALEEGGTEYSWQSSVTLSLFVISLLLWICFPIWERFQASRKTTQEAVFPWRLAIDRFAMGNFLCVAGRG